jgi:hypothetical protein
MLFEICKELNNFFDYERVYGKIAISNGEIAGVSFETGQYFRIVGSIFNDGVYQYPTDSSRLTDEEFDGAVWKMAVPPAFIDLCDEIKAWSDKNLLVDSAAMSPFQSESFGGYSYSKGSGSSESTNNAASWQSAFASRLNSWRKPRCRY